MTICRASHIVQCIQHIGQQPMDQLHLLNFPDWQKGRTFVKTKLVYLEAVQCVFQRERQRKVNNRK